MEEDKTGKVVQLFPKKKVESAPLSPPTSQETEASSEAMDDVAFFIKKRTQITDVVNVADRIEKTISTLQGYARNERNVRIRQEIVRESSLEELCKSLTNSSSSDWTAKPSYYLAVVYELSKRLNTVSEQVHKQRTTQGLAAGGEGREQAAIDTLYVMSNSERAIQACKHIDTITDFVFSIPGFEPNAQQIELLGHEVRLYPLSKICDRILDSKESEWKANPSLFGALILELDERTKAVKEVLTRS